MANPSPTNPGLTYDPRMKSAARFYQELEKELAKQGKKVKQGGSVPKPKDFHKPTPVKDPGPPGVINAPNPHRPKASGYAVRV